MQNAYRRTSLLLLAGLLFVTQSAMAGDNDRGVAQETLMKVKLPSRATVTKESKSLRLRLAMIVPGLFINFTYKVIKDSLAS